MLLKLLPESPEDGAETQSEIDYLWIGPPRNLGRSDLVYHSPHVSTTVCPTI